jgi:hypothetical protein
MKRLMKHFACLLAVALACCTLTACGGDDDDEPSNEESFSTDGQFIAQARCTTTMYDAFTIYKAPGGIDIHLSEGYVWIYDELISVSKEDNPISIPDSWKFPGFSGPGLWYSQDLGECIAIIGSDSGSLQLLNGSTIVATTNGVRYNNVDYYNKTYFNAHVGEWAGEPTDEDLKAEDVTVTMSATQTSSNSFYRQYKVTVTATGSNFTVKRISVNSTSGAYVSESKNTQENSATFTVGIAGSKKSTVVGRVVTSYGNTYTSESRIL